MFSTKLEVDRHVENSLRKINSDVERNLRSFAFAKLYYNIGDYEQARRYVSAYLSVKPASAEGQYLLGNALEKLGRRHAALEAYRTSFDIDPKQNNLVIKVCELLASDEDNLDLSGARYYCEKAQSFDPHNPAVFTLKERLIMSESRNPNDVVKLLLTELESRPTDVELRVRLLRHFLNYNQIHEAYKHASDIEQKNLSIFLNSLSWYETVSEVLARYKRDTSSVKNLPWEFWMLLVSVLDKLVALRLDEHSVNMKSSPECASAVFSFDQTLTVALENLSNCPERSLVEEFTKHYRAQVCFHLATLLFKQAKRDLIKYKEAVQFSLPLLFVAYHAQPSELRCIWLDHASEMNRQQVQRWHREASFRCSQSGHILLSLAKGKKALIIDKAMQSCSGLWREQVYKKLFLTREQQNKIKNSYFVTCPQLVDVTVLLPEQLELVKYDEVAQLVHPNSLHHMIWIGLNSKLSDFRCISFDGLQYSIKNLSNCSAESLNQLDVQAFLNCAILCVNSHIENDRQQIFYNVERPNVFPAAVTDQLGSLNQAKWFTAAYKVSKNEFGSDMGQLRLHLIRGIEVIRCIGNHGLDVKLLVSLANIFSERAKLLTKQSEIEYTEARADLYWKAALPLLEKMKNNQAISYGKNRLFDYKVKEINPKDVLVYLEDGKLFSAVQLLKCKEYEKALTLFEGLKSPYASFYQAQIYKSMADEQNKEQNKENVTSEMRSQRVILLSRSRDCLYLTLDRLREPTVDRKHPLNAQLGTEIEKIERLLSRIDPDVYTHRNECDGMSDENVSSVGSMGDQPNMYQNYTSYLSSVNGAGTLRNDHYHTTHSTPYTPIRKEARPSPERLDAQLRQMQASRDATINSIMEQNRIMVESHRTLVEELRGFKEVVLNLTSTVDGLKDIKKSVDELKESVNELQNFRDVTDLVHEMKKEIIDLKKDHQKSKNNQLSDEDLYVLDDEYNADYSINSNVSGFNPSLYPNYQGRLAGATSLAYGPPAVYPGLYPMYPYGSLGLPQAGSLAFGQDPQLPDFRSMNTLSQGLNQAGLTQANYGQSHVGLTHPALVQTGFGQAGLPATGLNQSALGQTIIGPIAPTQSIGQGGLPQTGQVGSGQLGLNQGGLLPTQPQTSLYKDPKLESGVLTSTVNTMPVVTTNIFTTQSISSMSFINTMSSTKAPPVNVVITASDPLPKVSVQTTQVLSVTIPPQHLKVNQPPKSQPHNYQIPLPVTTTPSTPCVFNQSPLPVATNSLLSNIAPPVYSAVDKSPSKSTGLGIQLEKSLSQSFNNSSLNNSKTDLNQSNRSTVSSTSVDEIDPCPDFKPIIPLPDEVPVNTGEEKEIILFCERAKLFRYTNKEWKERGVGNLKILKNSDSDMVLSSMPNNERAFMWAANDFSDEEMVLEKLCARFKSSEEARRFQEAFEKAKENFPDLNSSSEELEENNEKQLIHSQDQNQSFVKEDEVELDAKNTISLGGFTFISTPTFKPKESATTPITKPVTPEETVKTSPFASFSFSPTTGANTSAKSVLEFKPVQTLPGATNTSSIEELKASPTPSFALFPSKSFTASPSNFGVNFKSSMDFKPLQVPTKSGTSLTSTVSDASSTVDDVNVEEFVPTTEFTPVIPLPDLVEVKTGEENAEILFECKAKLLRFDSASKEWKERGVGIIKLLKETSVRLLMRRDVVHKICCNHQLLKNMIFSKMNNNPKALTWCAKDFAEGVLKNETLAIKFKTVEQADHFYKAILNALELLDENNLVKPDAKQILVIEENAFADSVASSVKSKEDKKIKSEPPSSDQSKSDLPIKTSGWGDKFKPKSGSWKCKTCYVVNEPKKNYCVACETPKNDTPCKKSPNESGSQFSFGIQPTGTTTAPTSFQFGKPASSWGDAFKPKEGSWECDQCLVRNDANKLYCASCENPKDASVPKKEANVGINLDTPGLKFNFGMPTTGAAKTTNTISGTSNTGATYSFGSQTTSTFTFGMTKTSENDVPVPQNEILNLSTVNKPFTFTLNKVDEKVSDIKEKSDENRDQFVFGSPQKHSFEFTPRSPRRQSSGPGDEESDNSYVEDEGDHIYFKPVIPLPAKVEVKTGEEEEEILYCHRAKLFRYSQGEWKERGIGDIKILLKKETGKLRVVMRREQILKICLNHALTADIEYRPKDDKTWLFCVSDFSEGEIVYQQLCVRFKTAEIAQEFKVAVDDALKKSLIADKNEEQPKEDVDSDIEIVSETHVTAEEEQEAIRLGLPPKFFAYRQLPDCSCDNCKKEDELLGPLQTHSSSGISSFGKTVFTFSPSMFSTKSDSAESQSINESNKTHAPNTFTPPSDVLRNLLSTPSLFNTQSTPKKDSEPVSFFSSPSLVNTAASKSNLFSPSASSTTSETTTIIKTSVEPKSNSDAFKNFSFTLNTSEAQKEVSSTTQSNSTGNIFGSSGSLFNTSTLNSGSVTPTAIPNNKIFGGPNTPSASIFGGNSKTNVTNIFGSLTKTTENDTKVGSSAPVFGSVATQFGSASEKSLSSFGSLTTKGSEKSIFGAFPSNTKLDSEEENNEEVVLKCDSNLSFATLAATGTETPFKKSEGDGGQSFAFLGAGTPVFASLKTSKVNQKKGKSKDKTLSGDEGEEDGAECTAEDYDPHYEPIVPLPATIVVSTGEEDEVPKFNERSKLFRFDDKLKEWKERGVGQMKLLYHPVKGTYRLLLRREQVHKVVLNMLITPDLNLQPIITSDKAWMWVGYNYAEDNAALEKLSARFKNTELAQAFCTAVQEAIVFIKQQQESKNLPSTIQNYGIEDISSETQEDDDDEEEREEVEDDDDEDDEDERSLMFKKRCTLSEQISSGEWKVVAMGEIEVFYDPEIFGAHIYVNNDAGVVVSNTIIGINTEMSLEEQQCTWKAVEWITDNPYWRTLRATFSSTAAADEFHLTYIEALQYAQQSDIVDDIRPPEHAEPDEE